jgi:outer membrane beta-barrel protein
VHCPQARRQPDPRPIVTVLACLAAALAAPAASAQYDDEEGGGFAVVIQDREFNLGHEFTVSTGTLPLDAFVKGIALTGRYTLHFDDFNAWEMLGVTYSLDVDSGLSEILASRFGLQPAQEARLHLVAETNYVAKPFYGKFALFNSVIIYQELFLNAGFTLSYWSDNSFRPGPDVGAAVRFFVADWLSLRFDIRHALVMNGIPLIDPNMKVDGVLQLLAGVSFNVGGG